MAEKERLRRVNLPTELWKEVMRVRCVINIGDRVEGPSLISTVRGLTREVFVSAAGSEGAMGVRRDVRLGPRMLLSVRQM